MPKKSHILGRKREEEKKNMPLRYEDPRLRVQKSACILPRGGGAIKPVKRMTKIMGGFFSVNLCRGGKEKFGLPKGRKTGLSP